MAISDDDLRHLERAVELAEQALEAGDEPYGSVLVGHDGQVLFEDHNHVVRGDETQHPELAIARWAAHHLDESARATATVYTSGEHCPMCSAAHGWVGLGRIVYAHSAEQAAAWAEECGAEPSPVAPLSITTVVPDAQVDGPAPQLEERMRALHVALHDR